MCAASHDRSASSSRKRLRRDEVVRSAVSEIAATLDASQDTEYPDTWVRWVGSAETGRASEQMGAIHDDVMAATRWTRNAFTYMPHPRQAGGQRLLSGLMCVLKAMVWSVKRKRKELCLCYGNGGFTWSSKSSETGQNKQWRHLQRMFGLSDDSLNAGVRAGEDAGRA